MILKEVFNNEWLDEEFPNNMKSLAKNPAKQEAFKKIIWKKLSDIAPAEGYPIIYDTNRPTAILPGLLNDRAFQSAISILAEREPYLPSIFPEFNETSGSVLSVWLNHTGEWKGIVIDEFFPYDRERATWAFTSTAKETWALVLEKALAKMYGCYQALEKGHPAHFIHDITGAPYDYFYFDEPEECWKYITKVDRLTTTVVAMLKDPRYIVTDENEINKEQTYCYAILDTQEVKAIKGAERIIKLRDPWKQKTWSGEWSAQSNKWTPALIKKLNPEGLTDEVFWIGINDFVKHYGMGFSFRIYPSYQHCSLRLKHSFQRNYSLVLMNVSTPGHIFLQVSQSDQKHFLNWEEKYVYSLVKVMVVGVDSKLQTKKFINGLYNKGRDCETDGLFEPGDYLIYVEVDWEQNINREIVLSNKSTWFIS